MHDAVALGLLGLEHAAGEHHVLHAGKPDKPRNTNRAAAADEDAARSLGQAEKSGLVGDADMRGGCRFEPAAQRCAMQRRDKGDVAARHRFEIRITVERERQPLRAPGLPILRGPVEVETSAEIVAMTEDDAAFGFFAGALDGFAQLFHHGRIEAVAFVRTVQADQRDLAFQFVGDRLFFAHELLLVRRDKSARYSARRFTGFLSCGSGSIRQVGILT